MKTEHVTFRAHVDVLKVVKKEAEKERVSKSVIIRRWIHAGMRSYNLNVEKE